MSDDLAEATARQYNDLVLDAARALESAAKRIRDMAYIETETRYGSVQDYERHVREVVGEASIVVGAMALPTLMWAAHNASEAAWAKIEKLRREAYREAEDCDDK